MARADVSVALVETGVSPRVDDVLRCLCGRASDRRGAVFGVGRPEVFPAGMRVVAPEAPTPAAAKNAALRAAGTPYVLLLAADTVVTPDVVETLARGLDSRPRLLVLAAWPCHEMGWVMPWLFRYPSLLAEVFGALNPLPRRHGPPRRGRREDVGRTWWFRLEAALVRREAALGLPPWPEGFRFGFEDAVWLRRAHEAGWRAEFGDEAFAYAFAPKRLGPVPGDIRLAWEASRARLIETLEAPREARLHLGIRRVRLALRAWKAGVLSALLPSLFRGPRSLARQTKWARRWSHAGRPPVEPAPGAERHVWWEDLS